MRGYVTLTDTTEVAMIKDELRIVVPGRAYYFMPKEPSAAESKIVMSQWYTCLKRSIKDIWTWENKHKSAQFTPTRKSNLSASLGECPDNLEGVLAHREYRARFKQFCDFSQGIENFDFVSQVELYETIASSKRLSKRSSKRDASSKNAYELAQDIVKCYVNEGSESQVNLSDSQRKVILRIMAKKDPEECGPALFEDARAEVLSLMETNYFLRFYREEMRKTGCFTVIYNQHGMRGYQAVLNHFGSVKVDIERLESFYTSKLDSVKGQLEIIRESFQYSHDVALGMFPTITESLSQFYRSNAIRFQGLTEFKIQLDEGVVFPLTWLSKSIALQLEAILDSDNRAMQVVKGAKKNTETSKKKLADLLWLKDLAKQSPFEFPTPEAEERLKLHSVEIGTISDEIEQCKMQVSKYEVIEQKCVYEIETHWIESLDKMEAMELRRIESTRRALKHAMEAEHAMNRSLYADTVNVHATIGKIDTTKDILRFVDNFSTRLKAQQDKEIII